MSEDINRSARLGDKPSPRGDRYGMRVALFDLEKEMSDEHG